MATRACESKSVPIDFNVKTTNFTVEHLHGLVEDSGLALLSRPITAGLSESKMAAEGRPFSSSRNPFPFFFFVSQPAPVLPAPGLIGVQPSHYPGDFVNYQPSDVHH